MNYESTSTSTFYPGRPNYPMQFGWMCPKCNSAHAPSVQTCPHSYGSQYSLCNGIPVGGIATGGALGG